MSYRIDCTLSARHHQTWVQSVTLSIFIHLSSLIHVCPDTLDGHGAQIDIGVNANSIIFSGLGGGCQTLDFPTFSIPERYNYKRAMQTF